MTQFSENGVISVNTHLKLVNQVINVEKKYFGVRFVKLFSEICKFCGESFTKKTEKSLFKQKKSLAKAVFTPFKILQ